MRQQHIASLSDPGHWPGPPSDSDPPRNGHAADIARITVMLGSTQRLGLICGGLLTADLAGAIVTTSALLRHGHDVAWSAAVLLVPVLAAWLTAALLLVLAEQPSASALAELRYAAGAPADPSAPWAPLGVPTLADADLGSAHVAPLIGAAVLAHARARRALTATVIATGGFLLWTAISLALAAVA
jgi:hypothetical protein